MKKLKIFLLLSILLCFGFALSSEVHAQGDGPKLVEVNDVLPATTQLKISWDSGLSLFLSFGFEYRINRLTGDTFIIVGDYAVDGDNIVFWIRNSDDEWVQIYQNGWMSPYTDYSGGHNYIVIDTSSWDVSTRTIDSIPSGININCFYWEDLNAPQTPSNAKPFEVGDTLPAGYIKISWDYNGFTLYGNEFISIEGTNGFVINISIRLDLQRVETSIMGDSFDTLVDNITIKLDNISVITKIESDEENEYYQSDLQNGIFWEVVTVDEYSLGYEDAREKFGYYDPITERWLSVSEYLDLYGYEKMGQTDFYNNFDKYFIPAMIIVFGGAIVLTLLKVFKGRE